MEWVLLVVAGLFSGIVGALVGLGGGVILVPAIVYLGAAGFIDGITPQTVVGLSVIMMIFTGLSSTIAYMKKKTVDFKSGAIFFAGSAPGTVIGAFVNRGLDLPSFQLYFGIMMVFNGEIIYGKYFNADTLSIFYPRCLHSSPFCFYALNWFGYARTQIGVVLDVF